MNIVQNVGGKVRGLAGSSWTPKKVAFTIGVVAIIGVVIALLRGGNESESVTTELPPTVRVATIANLEGADSATYVGTVRSVSEADIQSERGGRVTSVRVAPGATVTAGTIIGTLENASEQAAVLQAQGAYEAALASGRQSQVGVSEATTALERTKATTVTNIAGAYNSVLGIVKTDIDAYFANPQSPVPGLRINGQGDTERLNNGRVALNASLSRWQAESSILTPTSNLDAAITNARQYTSETIALVDLLIGALSRNTSGDASADAARKADIAKLTGVRSSLLGVQASLQNDAATLSAARDALSRAEINSANSGPSASNAQITQALGALRAAQANLEKTIFRSPISGTVEVLRIKSGDFLSPQTPVARVAGGKGLEVSVFIGEFDRDQFVVGETVSINNTATGTIVTIEPAIDPVTRKSEVKIATSDASLVNGDTVSVSLAPSSATSTASATRLQIPITAVKFTDTDGVVFVVEDNKLKARPVEVGPISGSLVTILSGIDATTEFVIDARGKTDGEVVEVIRD